MRILYRAALVVCLFAVLSLIATPRSPAAVEEFKASYSKSLHMVPMRDGVRLMTIVYAPKRTDQDYPMLLFRTPYSVGPYGPDDYRSTLGPSEHFRKEGYIFVYQDVRGQFKSEGEFEVMKPVYTMLGNPGGVDESTDTYDTIEWMLKNIPHHNGRVGQWGISYPGWQTVMGMVRAHPALKASSPQASPADMYIGDDFHHNGAFRFMYTFHWLAFNAPSRSQPGESRGEPVFRYGTPDGYRFFLDIGPVSNVNARYFRNRVPTWNAYMEHGNYDEYWRQRDALQYLKRIKHPVLHVAAWFDAEDFYGPMTIYETIEKETPDNQSLLVVGPWRHGGWAGEAGDSLGDIRFKSNTAEFYRQEIEFPFFQHHLKGKPAPSLAEATVFETGSNEWKSYDRWPPREAAARNLYLREQGRLAFEPPGKLPEDTFDSFISDPAKPVPFSAELRTTQGHTWMVEDQRFAACRPDVLVYQTEPLERDVLVAGPVVASLHVSTTGTDADWIAKLIDVYPPEAPNDSPRGAQVAMGGYQMLVAGEVFRAKYRHGFDRPEPLTPGEIAKIEFHLRDKCHRFLKGHRIMAQLQSSWFPVIDRNPQRYVDIYRAVETDFQKAEHRLYRTPERASHIRLCVLPTD